MSFRSIITNQGFTERQAEIKRHGVRRECSACGHAEHREHQSFAVARGLERASLACDTGAAKTSILFRKRMKASSDKAHATSDLYCSACGSTDWVEIPDVN